MTDVWNTRLLNHQAFARLFLLTELDQVLVSRRDENPLSVKQNRFSPSQSLFFWWRGWQEVCHCEVTSGGGGQALWGRMGPRCISEGSREWWSPARLENVYRRKIGIHRQGLLTMEWRG